MDDALCSTPDVCIVGAGPAGLAAALALGSAGRRVLLLESGATGPSARAQELNDGDHEGVDYLGLKHTRHRQVGGTANIWNVEFQGVPGAKYAPLSACDMAEWPFGLAELEPFYREAQALCGLGPFEYDAAYWATAERPPFTLAGTGLANRVYQFGTAEQFNRTLVERLPETVTLLSSTTVVGLVAGPGGGRVVGIKAIDAAGRALAVRPRALLLACGAVENARLLLLSDELRPSGLPWLGRGFMEHARDFSLRLVPASPELFARAAFYDLHQGADGTWIGGRLALTDDAVRELGLPNAAITLLPHRRQGRYRDRLTRLLRPLRHLGRAPRARRYGWSDAPSPATTFDAFDLVVNLEQRPHPWNRVELGSRYDRFGSPLPRLRLRWTEQEQALLDQFRNRLRDWLADAGLGRLQAVEGTPPDLNAHHHAGTTRMAEGPREGVVDPHGRVFGFDNLHLTGASVFPTAGFANPTLTIVALALRQARHLDAVLG